MNTYKLNPVGIINQLDTCQEIKVVEEYQDALLHLDKFSHVILLWLNNDPGRLIKKLKNSQLSSYLSTANGSSLSPVEIGISKIKGIDEKRGIININNMIIPNSTVILDIKPYFPIEDRVKNYKIPEEFSSLPDFVPETLPDELIKILHSDQFSQFNKNGNDMSVYQCGHIHKKSGQCRIELTNARDEFFDRLDSFSHINILWWFNRFEKDRYRRSTQCNPPYENAPRTGIFASRSPVRPNPVGLTTARIIKINRKKKIIEISPVDAFHNTPVIDVKPYMPHISRIRESKIPQWIDHWSEWFEDDELTNSNGVVSMSESDYNRLKGLGNYGNQTEKKAVLNTVKTIKEVNDNEFIVISGARENNLKNISVNIPKNKMTVITGLSGSGKSSLAFDTIYAESRRRFMDSISSTGRQFFKQFEKPAVDQITNLPPAIAVEQKSISRNTRSTVGTITDISDLLRLLFARIGVRHCPKCGMAVEPKTIPEIITLLSNLQSGMSFDIVSLKTNKKKYQFTAPERKDIRKFGSSLKPAVNEMLEAESGALKIVTEDNDEFILHTRNHCYYCGTSFFELTPSFFSSNNPESMCPDCDGLGTQMMISPELIVSQSDKSILDGASAWWGDLRKFMKKPTGNWFKGEVIALANSMKIDLEKPWNKLPSAFCKKALFGSDGEEVQLTYYGSRGRSGDISRPVEGAVNHIKRLFKNSHGKRAADYLIQFMDEKECSTCMGEQLSAEARYVTAGNKRYPEVMSLSIEMLKNWAEKLNRQVSEKDAVISNGIIQSLIHKTDSLINVGLHYLTPKRPLPTLSGGEAQRLRLASQLGCGLSNLLYILDEPSIGLHQSDHSKLIKTMKELRDSGNTLVIVEHDKETMLEADFLIDVGPGAGINGGKVIAQGSPKEVIKNKNSITGRYLQETFSSGKKNTAQKKVFNSCLKLYGAYKNNLKNIDVSFPLGAFICITGKSGSGKSSLITHTLSPVLTYYCNHNILLKSDYKRIEGIENIDNIISITQEPIGRTPRSNPATYTGVFDEIRNIFASTGHAKNKRYSINRFSFNSKEGQCESCSGEGRKKIEMNFMPDVWITCSECGGKRFNSETLEITYKEKTIADVLEMDIDEACRLFAEDKKTSGILNTLQDVGLGYLKLGQSALTLSGGEAQRVKLAKELSKSRVGRTVYILDEPTTGLHFQDIEHLLNLLHRIVNAGNTVIVIEHNIDMIRNADWIIDLGPEGGDKGGYIIAEGTPEEVKKCKNSITGNLVQEY